jgi:hypothetical protein
LTIVVSQNSAMNWRATSIRHQFPCNPWGTCSVKASAANTTGTAQRHNRVRHTGIQSPLALHNLYTRGCSVRPRSAGVSPLAWAASAAFQARSLAASILSFGWRRHGALRTDGEGATLVVREGAGRVVVLGRRGRGLF